jgi:protein arginine N-methyltransferase 2
MTSMEEDTSVPSLDAAKVRAMIEACSVGNFAVIEPLLKKNPTYACQQDEATGQSPLMVSAAVGNGGLCQTLLEEGAPWNALDRQGRCAGNYATDNQHWAVVNLLVEWGVRAELILGMIERSQRETNGGAAVLPESQGLVEQEPSTKPDYLRQRLSYSADGNSLLDADKDAVMMEWERPLMKAHAQILMEGGKKRVMNVGFGMGIIDSAIQEMSPSQHIIIEAHPDVYKRMLDEKWDKKPNVRICFGRWQEVIPQLIRENVLLDAIFYDTYAEHQSDLEDFHSQMVHLLSKPNGIYSFFNGLAPDNLFFHGVACQCVKLQLSQLGLDSDFLSCEIQVKDEVWEGIRRKYWHGRDTYYLPRCTWNPQFLATGSTEINAVVEDARKRAHDDVAGGSGLKRPKMG